MDRRLRRFYLYPALVAFLILLWGGVTFPKEPKNPGREDRSGKSVWNRILCLPQNKNIKVTNAQGSMHRGPAEKNFARRGQCARKHPADNGVAQAYRKVASTVLRGSEPKCRCRRGGSYSVVYWPSPSASWSIGAMEGPPKAESDLSLSFE